MKMPLAVCLVASLLAAAAPVRGEELGRLFLSPERRAVLERQRQLNIRQAEVKEVEVGTTLNVNGIVRRSSGRTTAWINNVPQEEGGGVRIEVDRADPARALVLAGEETALRVKVGETVNRSTGETTSGLGGGHIRVNRADGRLR